MQTLTLKSGDLRLDYSGGFLRYIRLGDTEVIRMIYFALRDHNWGTLPLEILEESIISEADHFDISYTAHNILDDRPVLRWEVEIRGSKEETVSFAFKGTFLEDFQRNRAGFCVLHPLRETAGQAFRVTHPDGSFTNACFPIHISPDQPCRDIQQFNWTTSTGVQAALYFEKEVFEMEDQRNWTDASFKTYCTPLTLPYPVLMKQGSQIEQQAVLKIISSSKKLLTEVAEVAIRLDLEEHHKLPSFGSCVPLFPELPGPAILEAIQNIPLSSVRADLFFQVNQWQSSLDKIWAYQTAVEKPLHLVIHDAGGSLNQLIGQIKNNDLPQKLSAISFLTEDPARQMECRQAFPRQKHGIGTAHYFTQLNRNRPDLTFADFVFFSNNPQVHAFDEASIVETIEGQTATVESCRQFAQSTPIWVSPVSLRARFNPDASDAAEPKLAYAFPPDPRRSSLFMAGWTLACLAALAKAGAAHIDWFELTGARGLIEKHTVTPVYLILQNILSLAPSKVYAVQSTYPLQLSGLGLISDETPYLILANHTDQEVKFQMKEVTQWIRQWSLDRSNVEVQIQNKSLSLSSSPIEKLSIPPNAIQGWKYTKS